MNFILMLFEGLLVFQVVIFIAFNVFALFFSKKSSNIHKNSDSTFKIALVIPCYNEERVIVKKLENSLAALSFNVQSNIYIVDDVSTDNTFVLADKYRAVNNLKNVFIWKNPGSKGKPAALNWVFTQLKEDIIVITDADAVLEKDAIAKLVSNFGDPSVGAVTGRIITNRGNNLAQKEEGLYRRISELWRKAESNLDSCAIFNGPLMAFRAELSSQIKIDERGYADDTNLAYLIRRLGYRAVYEPDALVSEDVSSLMSVRTKQEMRRARGLTRVVLKNIDVLGRFGYFGKVIYPFSLFNYVVSPVLTLFLIFLLPLVIITYPILLVIFSLLLIPLVRTAVLGYLYRQLALVAGLIIPSEGRWEPIRS